MSSALLTIPPNLTKQDIVTLLRSRLEADGFTIAQVDASRPWGAFFRVVNAQADKFLEQYFPGAQIPPMARGGERSPKFLLVAPHQRLSWQHHDRRSEFWRVLSGDVGIYISPTNEQPKDVRVMHVGDTVELAQGMRHRLVGLDQWGVVAEIWIHSNAQQPSDENDIHRLQDDYAR